MDDTDAIEPFGFFTLDALRAGWYLIWRQMIRVVPAVAAVLLAGVLLTRVGLGAFSVTVMSLGFVAATIWAAVLIPRLTIQWAEQWYGATLTGPLRIWWGVCWRVFVASLIAAVISTPPNFVALSLTTSFPHSALGLVGSVLTLLLGVASFAVAMLATGWAVSKVAVGQLPVLAALPPGSPAMAGAGAAGAPSTVADLEPVLVEAPASLAAAAVSVAAGPVAPATPVARPVPAPSAPRPAAASDARQCPKCGLYETEHGTVIGWYCRICGWREGRARR